MSLKVMTDCKILSIIFIRLNCNRLKEGELIEARQENLEGFVGAYVMNLCSDRFLELVDGKPVSEKQFKAIWGKVLEEAGCGDLDEILWTFIVCEIFE